ncbi:MAG: hypothetical protein HKM07_06325 [Chlamydiae bacterium]|nr:hypothetical protein [Chlamydiota bacterium]
MKKSSWCKIALLSLIGLAVFLEIYDTMTDRKAFFLERWLFSNRGYAKEMEIKTYLLTDEQLAWSLSHQDEEIKQPSQKDLYNRNVNLLLRIKNHRGASAWGSLAWKTKYQGWQMLQVGGLSCYDKKFADFVVPIGIQKVANSDELPEEVRVKWLSLYTKI